MNNSLCEIYFYYFHIKRGITLDLWLIENSVQLEDVKIFHRLFLRIFLKGMKERCNFLLACYFQSLILESKMKLEGRSILGGF